MFIEEPLIWRDYRILDSFDPEYIRERGKDDEFGILLCFHAEMFSFFCFTVFFKSFSLKFSVIQFENKRVDLLVCVVLGKT